MTEMQDGRMKTALIGLTLDYLFRYPEIGAVRALFCADAIITLDSIDAGVEFFDEPFFIEYEHVLVFFGCCRAAASSGPVRLHHNGDIYHETSDTETTAYTPAAAANIAVRM